MHVDVVGGAAADALSWPTGFVNVREDVPAAGRIGCRPSAGPRGTGACCAC